MLGVVDWRAKFTPLSEDLYNPLKVLLPDLPQYAYTTAELEGAIANANLSFTGNAKSKVGVLGHVAPSSVEYLIQPSPAA